MKSEDVLQVITKFNSGLNPDKQQAIVPCYIGPTGVGKTERIVGLAESDGKFVRRLLLQSMLPEDILGLPRVIDGITEWSMPRWAHELRESPGILFLDELDKARHECYSAALTLLAEKRLRDTRLHPQTIIVAAMQPVTPAEWLSDQTGQAMSARLCFLPVVQDWDFLGTKLSIDLSALPKNGAIELPILPRPSPRQVDWFINFCRHNPKDRLVWEKAAEGMFTKDQGDFLIETISKGMSCGGVTREDLVAVLKEDGVKLVAKLTIPEIVLLAADIFHYGNCRTLQAALKRVWVEGDEDNAKNYLEIQHNELLARVKANGGKLEVLQGAPDKEVQKTIEETAYIIGNDYWSKRSTSTGDVANVKSK